MATRRQPGRGLHRLLRDHLQRCPLRHLYLCRLQNGLQQRRTGLPHLHREVAPRQHRAERHLDQLAAAIQQNKLHLPRRRGLRPPLRRDQGGGLDAHSHLTPHLDLQLQAGHRRRLLALGGLQPDEEVSRVFRRSLFVVEDMQPGELFTEANVRSIRPGHGLHTRYLPEVLGRRASQPIARGTPLAWGHVG